MDVSLGSLVSIAALLLSIAAFVLSLRAYRQRVRYHPQPKMVIEWGDIAPFNGLFVRAATLVNHGDGAARDVNVHVEFAMPEDAAWEKKDVLEPGDRLVLGVPVIDGVRHGWGAYGESYERDGDPATYHGVTPVVTVTWRQPPFDKGPQTLAVRAPETPEELKALGRKAED